MGQILSQSIKGSTRNKTADGAGGGTRQCKNTWETFLVDSSNKEELFEFLSSEAIKNKPYPASNDVYLTSGAKVVYIGPGD